jgi:hypothetical protein
MADLQALNLLTLARGNPAGSSVPGTDLEVFAPDTPQKEHLESAWWLLVLEGDLIVDLPHGDFRTLKAGDSLHLPAGLDITLTPLGRVVALRRR